MALKFPGTVFLPSLCMGLFVCLLSACGSSTEDAAPKSCDTSQATVATATYSELYAKVFAPQCGACHGPGTNSGTLGGPDMRTAATFYNGLVGKKGSDYPGWLTYQKNRQSCLSFDLISNSAADQSVVVAVLDSSVTLPGCDVKYHRDIPQNICIGTNDLSKLKEWITAGALQ